MDNAENLATLGSKTRDEDKQSKNTTQYATGHTTLRKEKQIKYIRHEPSYQQREVKMIRTSFFYAKRTLQHGRDKYKQ